MESTEHILTAGLDLLMEIISKLFHIFYNYRYLLRHVFMEAKSAPQNQ